MPAPVPVPVPAPFPVPGLPFLLALGLAQLARGVKSLPLTDPTRTSTLDAFIQGVPAYRDHGDPGRSPALQSPLHAQPGNKSHFHIHFVTLTNGLG